MARGLKDLAKDLRDLKPTFASYANEQAKRVAMNVVNVLVRNTPVDTSTALSNWQVGVGQKPSSVIPAYVLGIKGSTQVDSIAATIVAAQTALESKQPGQSIWISNNLDYIYNLNQGSSYQAPAGFVEASVLIARKTIENPNLKL